MCRPETAALEVQSPLVVPSLLPVPPGTFTRKVVKQQRREQKVATKLQRKEAKRELTRQHIVQLRIKRLGTEKESQQFPSVTIVDAKCQNNVTYFVLNCQTTRAEWQVRRRYNEFNALRQALGARSSRIGCEFPNKTGFSQCKGLLLEKRQQMLQAWMNGLLSEFSTGGDGRHKVFARQRNQKCELLQAFFAYNRDGQPVISSEEDEAVSSVQAVECQSLNEASPQEGLQAQAFQALHFGSDSEDSHTAPETEAVYRVDVPSGLEPGEQFFVDIDDKTYALSMPEEKVAILQFALPNNQ